MLIPTMFMRRKSMSVMYNIWRGRLFVGPRDLGSATIWTTNNNHIPAIGGDLKMTSVGEYKDLWEKIIGTKPFNLTKGSKDVYGTSVSAFTLHGYSPSFHDLTKEMTATSHPQILTGELYNPNVQICIALVPQCKELEDLGLGKKDHTQPHMHAIFVSSVTIEKTMSVYSSQRSIELLKMRNTATVEKYSPRNVYRLQAKEVSSSESECNINRMEIQEPHSKLDVQNKESKQCNTALQMCDPGSEILENLPGKNSELSDEVPVRASLDGKMSKEFVFPSEVTKGVSDSCVTQTNANDISVTEKQDEMPSKLEVSLVSGARTSEMNGQLLSGSDKYTSVLLLSDKFEPTAAGLENVLTLITEPVILEKKSCCRFEKIHGECQHNETNIIKRIDHVLLRKIWNLQSPDEVRKTKVSQGAVTDRKAKLRDIPFVSCDVTKGSDQSPLCMKKSKYLELDKMTPIDKNMATFSPLKGSHIDWESARCLSMASPSAVDVRRAHSFKANMLIRKILNLHSPDEGEKTKVSQGAVSDRKAKLREIPFVSCDVAKGSDQSSLCLNKNEYLELDEMTRIDKNTAIFTPLEVSRIDWESERCLSMDTPSAIDVRRVHLFHAKSDDRMKLKMPVMRKTNRLSYCSLEEIVKLQGLVYVRPDKVKDLLKSPFLCKMSYTSGIRFVVCISLADIVNGVGRLLLKSKLLLLVHHTALVDNHLERLLEGIIEDRKRNIEHHHQVYVSKATLKLCVLSLSCTQRVTADEDRVFRTVLRNLYTITRCLKSCAGQVIDGGPWKNLGGKSPIRDYLHCLRVTHHCLKYAHRHAAVLVGERNWSAKTVGKEFYSTATARNLFMEFFN